MGEGSLDGGVGSCSRQGEAGGRDRACSPAKQEWLISISNGAYLKNSDRISILQGIPSSDP